ncbi:MAG: gliding motility-associated-like protein [Saprospiraceae bacterium]|jgi:gliding motility-associated-like protein
MKKIYVYIFLVLCSSVCLAQEICNNAIDDDNDGLVDLNDNDCRCNSFSLIPNHSFEDTLCCPINSSEMACLNNWIQVSDATTDYYNTCGFIFYEEIPIPPSPYLEGNGFVGFFGDGQIAATYKEYLGVCIDSALEKDSIYQMSFYIGFGIQHDQSAASPSPVEITLFGSTDCASIPYDGFECPTQTAPLNWIELATVFVSGENEWKRTALTFSPSIDVSAIVIGTGCDFFLNTPNTYHFIDDIIIDKNSSFIQLISGLTCLGNAVLGIPYDPLDSYQWYKDGIAIIGANSNTLNIIAGETGEGRYQILIETEDTPCVLTDFYKIVLDGYPVADLGEDTFICDNSSFIIGEENIGIDFFWNTGETTRTIEISEPGEYSVTVINECGEESDVIIILDQEQQPSCSFEVPNAFTPNNDGVSDEIKPITDCCIVDYTFSVFSRFGNLVFETSDILDAWDGSYKNAHLPADVYIWAATYSITQEEQTIHQKKIGDITLIR